MAPRLFTQLLYLATGLALSGVGSAMGPIGNLEIVNKDIAPDGFTRPYIIFVGCWNIMFISFL